MSISVVLEKKFKKTKIIKRIIQTGIEPAIARSGLYSKFKALTTTPSNLATYNTGPSIEIKITPEFEIESRRKNGFAPRLTASNKLTP